MRCAAWQRVGNARLGEIMASKRTVGVALCGFGRAGQIHFQGIRRNPRCVLKYIVDQVENEAVKKTVCGKLDEHLVQGVQLVSPGSFDDVQASYIIFVLHDKVMYE